MSSPVPWVVPASGGERDDVVVAPAAARGEGVGTQRDGPAATPGGASA
ncbi:hypothetical protein AB0B63_20460 [Micromonospora sp. NPDC049081]